jgi:p-aminobenzoyl-glutamate transporter AbgT
MSQSKPASGEKRGLLGTFLDTIEWVGNKLPDPAVPFVIGIAIVWLLSAVFSYVDFAESLPGKTEPIRIMNLLAPE